MAKIGLLGTGLIGASIGLGLRAAGHRIVGWDPAADALAEASAIGALDETAETRPELIAAGIDVLVLAGPPHAVLEEVMRPLPDVLVFDVAGVKSPIVAAAAGKGRFVGTHPMAGRETTGPTAASAALFRGAAWVVVADGADPVDVELVESLIADLGGRPIRMSAAEHDVAVAAVSHLPQILAAALIEAASDRTAALDLAAGSFRDLTRVAASDPHPWVQLLIANREAVTSVVHDFRRRLEEIADAVEQGDATHLEDLLTKARRLRRALAPPVVGVRVALADRPGELALVGHALERSAVDVRDLQLRHAPHGGGGVLTLSVRPGDAEPLRNALAAEGLLLVD